jgi:hypothetical protein
MPGLPQIITHQLVQVVDGRGYAVSGDVGGRPGFDRRCPPRTYRLPVDETKSIRVLYNLQVYQRRMG